jgi:hypothetical protein
MLSQALEGMGIDEKSLALQLNTDSVDLNRGDLSDPRIPAPGNGHFRGQGHRLGCRHRRPFAQSVDEAQHHRPIF